ncbi:uncharacterized protein OCT59_023391 [Rhizophagus irregularis]|uniref:uncharacterized protein n=1 Tax=Rhizophagus irregularis TaxID=588596 RepID=UPI000CC97F83|nr:hypothetical protein OCT59_023391 [Rhizophagus irregularis]
MGSSLRIHRFADKLSLFFEAPRNPLLDKNSEVHRGEEMSLASIERKNMTREDTKYGKKRSGHKIDIYSVLIIWNISARKHTPMKIFITRNQLTTNISFFVK